MVLRKVGWRVIASAAVCVAAAGAMTAAQTRAGAMDFGNPGSPPEDIPMTTGGTQTLRWGGPVPPAPRPGEVPVYVPSQSAYPSRAEPHHAPPAQAYPEPEQVYAPEPEQVYAPEPETDPQPEPQERPEAVEPEGGEGAGPDAGFEPEPAEDAAPRRLYTPREASEQPNEAGEPDPDGGFAEPAPERFDPSAGEAQGELSPLDAPVEIDEERFGSAAVPGVDPWDGLKEVTPGVAPPRRDQGTERLPRRDRPIGARPEGRVVPEAERRIERARPSYASLERMAPPRRAAEPERGSIFERGALEDETPTGYQPMPKSEVMCRRALQKLGVRFVDQTTIRRSRSCGIDYPVKITEIAPGLAMRPAATLNCEAALRVAEWVDDEVKPAARWKLLKRPTVMINASSYRCSRIAGSRSISQHASGNALDVRGFKFSDGFVMDIEKKGFFEFRQKAFQKSVRQSACRHFGTVLGPGYNEDHADHLHLDAKHRGRAVCK